MQDLNSGDGCQRSWVKNDSIGAYVDIWGLRVIYYSCLWLGGRKKIPDLSRRNYSDLWISDIWIQDLCPINMCSSSDGNSENWFCGWKYSVIQSRRHNSGGKELHSFGLHRPKIQCCAIFWWIWTGNGFVYCTWGYWIHYIRWKGFYPCFKWGPACAKYPTFIIKPKSIAALWDSYPR